MGTRGKGGGGLKDRTYTLFTKGPQWHKGEGVLEWGTAERTAPPPALTKGSM